MPRTTINVVFNGRDNGLLNLFNTINGAITRLDSNMNKLEASISRVDTRLKSLKSNSGFLSSLGNINIKNNNSVQSLGLRNFQQALAGGSSFMTSLLSRTASVTSSVFRGVTSTITGAVSSAYKNVSGMIAFVDKAIMTFGNSIRQIAQGIQSFGIAFSIFVSAPIARILQGVVSEAVNFDDAMTLVRKTTGATQQDIDKLGESLTQLSLGLPTSREDLAKIAEDWGAIGIAISDDTGVQQMTELSRLTAMFVSSVRGVTPEDAVEKLGRFAAIYYPDISSFVNEAEKLMSVISALEDVAPVDAGEILSAAQRMAPVTKALEIDPEVALGLATAVASVNVSAERAGTQTASALIDMAVNTDKVAKLFNTTEENIKSLMSANPEQFFLTMAASIGAIEDPLKRVQTVDDIFGKVGGKSVGSLAANLDNVSLMMRTANDEFAKGTYLQWQFEASLESSKSQLQILRNNLTYAGSAIGDALLPYITKFVALAVPAIQMATNWFKSLNDQVKIQVVAWIAFLAIAGPVVVFFSSLLFMIGLTISGLSSMFGVVLMMAQGIMGFAGAIMGLLSPVNLLVAALAGLLIYSVYIAKDLTAAGGIVQNYIGRAFEWGYNLISSFASGIQSAASAAYNAIVSVINSFIGLIQAFSPPKKGPLKNITQWGEGLMTAYADGIVKGGGAVQQAASYISTGLKSILEGFSPESVSMFSTVFNSIKGTINAVASHIGLATGATNQRIEQASMAVATFIQNLKTGIPDDLQELAGFLGGLGGDFETLIVMQNKYAEGEKRLRDIENALKAINTETDKMISAVVAQEGLTADQQSAMIRRIKLEQAAKEAALQAEKDSISLQQDNLKNDIDKKQEIIDILTGLIFPSEGGLGSDRNPFDKVDKPDKGNGIEPIDMVPFEDAAGVLDRVKDRFDQTGQSAETFTEKLGKARLMIEGFVAAIRGDDKTSYSAMPDAFWEGWSRGEEIRTKVLDFLTKLDTIIQKIKDTKQIINDGVFAFIVGYNSGQNGGEINWDMLSFLGGLSAVMLVLGWAAGAAAQSVEDFMTSIFTRSDSGEKSPIEQVMDRIYNAFVAFKNAWDAETKDIDLAATARSFGRIGLAISGLVSSEQVWSVLGHVMGGLAFALDRVVIGIDGIIQVLAIFAGMGNKKSFEDMYQSFYKGAKPAKELADEAGRVYDNLIKIKEGVDNAIANVKRWWNFLLGKEDTESPTSMENQGASGGGSGGFGASTNPQSGGGGKRGFGTVGKNWGQSIIDGAVSFFKGEEASLQLGTAMTSAGDMAQMNTVKQTNQTGEFWAGDILTGITTWFNNPTAVGFAMSTLSISQGLWRLATGQAAFKMHGEQLAGDNISGLDSKFNTDTSYLLTLITRIGLWIKENVQLIFDKGKDFGNGIIDGIKDALTSAGDAIWGALSQALDAVYEKLPDWFLILIGRKPAEAKKEEEKKNNDVNKTGSADQSKRSLFDVGKGGVNGYVPQTAASGLNITINIDPSVAAQIDRRSIDRLAEEIYTKLVRDMRLAGV